MLYIMTAVHNRYNITSRFIDALKCQSYKPFQLLLVDDGSTDGTDAMVKEQLPNSIVLHGDGNLWWGGALHKAYNYLRSIETKDDDCALIINDDTRFDNDFLECGVNLIASNPNTFIPAIGYSVNDSSIQDGAVHWDFCTGDNWVLEPGKSGNCASTRALFCRVKDFLATGGFRPLLLPHYGSDYEFTIRVSKKGFQIKSFPELVCRFDERTTGDRDYVRHSKRELIKRMFSKRSSFNPVYKMNLLVLITPLPLLPKVMFCQAKRILSNIKSGEKKG